MGQDHDGLGLRQVTDVTTDHCKIDFSRGELPADSTVVPVSMTFSRTGAPSETSWLAIADIAFAPSPSIVPTASERVTGRLY